ncbi:aldo/keto reductase [Cystobacter ferrugineus]|uniref:aldo/keto reductase n=1 Tax=Cystobacter ferrugineus TaxID=83449 RepID=UPI000A797145|nr:aldo/keto reductase [Cystobacter ferrugineus]
MASSSRAATCPSIVWATALHPYAKGVVVATKAGLVRTGPHEWHPVGAPKYLRQELELSLRRLKLERIGLYQLHRIDWVLALVGG